MHLISLQTLIFWLGVLEKNTSLELVQGQKYRGISVDRTLYIVIIDVLVFC